MISESVTAPWPGHFRKLLDDNPPLLHVEQVELIRRWQQEGDEEARNRLALSSLRFIASIALGYQGRGMELVDLVQEGTLGCMEAINRFDETRGFRFISYAVHWIRQAIQTALTDQAITIRLPPSRAGANRKALEARGRIEQQKGRTVSLREAAEVVRGECATTGQPYPATDDSLGWVIWSLDTPVVAHEDQGDRVRLGHRLDLANEENSEIGVERRELVEVIDDLIAVPDSRERYVLSRYFGLNGAEATTLKKIGEELGLTRERVRQIRDEAMKKIQTRRNGHRAELLEMVR